MLTHGVGRTRFALQKYAAMVVVVVALGAVFWLSLSVATAIAGTPVGAGDLAVAFVRLTLLGLAVGSVSFAVGGATGRRQAAVAAGAGVGVLMYLLNTLAVMNETVRPFRYVSLFYWAGGASPLGKPLDWSGVLVLVATSAGAAGGRPSCCSSGATCTSERPRRARAAPARTGAGPRPRHPPSRRDRAAVSSRLSRGGRASSSTRSDVVLPALRTRLSQCSRASPEPQAGHTTCAYGGWSSSANASPHAQHR